MVKKCIKKIAIILVAVMCAVVVHVSVSAIDLGELLGYTPEEWLSMLFSQNATTQEDPKNTTETKPTTTDPVKTTGSGSVTTQPTTNSYNYTTQNYYYNNNSYTTVSPNTTAITTEPVTEVDSTSFSSLLEQYESDTAMQYVVPTASEQYTLNAGLVVNDGNGSSFTWQTAALIGAAVLFVILAALVIALAVQQKKKTEEKARAESKTDSDSDVQSKSREPVSVEVMTQARIEELLGKKNEDGTYNYSEMTSEESAAAIKNAALLNQLRSSYSDPLIRKYTDEPVRFSADNAGYDENLTASEILSATDSMLEDISGNDSTSYTPSESSSEKSKFDEIFSEVSERLCPECHKAVDSSDMFCHNCGAYVG